MDQESQSFYPLGQDQILDYQRDGFIHLESVLSEEDLGRYSEEVSRLVAEHNPLHAKPFESRTTYEKAFVQVVNLWMKSDLIRDFVFSKRLARIACQLIKARGVRLYHDQALFKERGGGITPWHADQYYWPLSSEKTCTVWIPLQDTPKEMGPLSFSKGSHLFEQGRDLVISDESERTLQKLLSDQAFEYVMHSYRLGDVSFHSGWTYHRAEPNLSNKVRKAMTIIYMDADMRVSKSLRPEHDADRAAFLPSRLEGETANTALNPLLFP